MHLSLFLAFHIGAVFSSVLPRHQPTSNARQKQAPLGLFNELEELSRIIDISYCVGSSSLGISKPFECASRCSDFKSFELVKTWNTGQLLADSCGYIALSHPPSPPRIIVAFRGTYSVANTISDLSTIPQDYEPYPGNEEQDSQSRRRRFVPRDANPKNGECTNCTVHMGFMRSWQNTKPEILPQIEELMKLHPEYRLTLVGHSLGGAVATLAGLDFNGRGWNPKVVTFGEPRVGNGGLAEYIDKSFETEEHGINMVRATHVDDPVPLLPLTEWGFRPHAGEVYISKAELPPEVQDIQICEGPADPNCLSGAEGGLQEMFSMSIEQPTDVEGFKDWWESHKGSFSIPARWKIWQLFFAHRDYFWRLGLCVPWVGSKVLDSQLPAKNDAGQFEL